MSAIRRIATVVSLLSAVGTAHAQSNVRPVARIQVPWETLDALTSRPAAEASDRHGRLLRDADAATDERRIELDFAGRAQSGADIQGGGRVASQRGAWNVTFAREVAGERVLAFSLENEATFYDFGGNGNFAGASDDPFNDMYRTALASTLYVPWSANTSLFAGVRMTVAGEDDARISDSFYLGGATGVAYRAREDLGLSLGISASQRFEDDPWVIPFLGVDWRFDRFRLQLEGERVDFSFAPRRDVELGLHAAYEQRQYRTNRDGPLAGGAFRDEQIDVGASIAWRPAAGVELRLGAGVTPWRELTFIGNDGTAEEREPGSSMYGELALRLSL